jgi:hypothetical protein
VEPQARRKMEEDQEDQNISVKETAKFMGTSEDLFLKEAVQDELALEIAKKIADQCMSEQRNDERMEWNLKNAVLFGFGILTTLGYGKIEPQTTNGRLFTVIYGFIGDVRKYKFFLIKM